MSESIVTAPESQSNRLESPTKPAQPDGQPLPPSPTSDQAHDLHSPKKSSKPTAPVPKPRRASPSSQRHTDLSSLSAPPVPPPKPVSPPASPMRSRTLIMSSTKPKPAVRRRKKFQTPLENSHAAGEAAIASPEATPPLSRSNSQTEQKDGATVDGVEGMEGGGSDTSPQGEDDKANLQEEVGVKELPTGKGGGSETESLAHVHENHVSEETDGQIPEMEYLQSAEVHILVREDSVSRTVLESTSTRTHFDSSKDVQEKEFPSRGSSVEEVQLRLRDDSISVGFPPYKHRVGNEDVQGPPVVRVREPTPVLNGTEKKDGEEGEKEQEGEEEREDEEGEREREDDEREGGEKEERSADEMEPLAPIKTLSKPVPSPRPKRPPPLPNPYQAKTPPLPPKKRMLTAASLKEGHDNVRPPADGRATVTLPRDLPPRNGSPEQQRPLSTGDGFKFPPPARPPPPRPPPPKAKPHTKEPIYEEIEEGGEESKRYSMGDLPDEPKRLLSRPENISSLSLESTSSLSSSQTSLTPTSPSVRSANSMETKALRRPGRMATISYGNRRLVQGGEEEDATKKLVRRQTSVPNRKNRPFSDASLEILEGYEVIPGGANLEDVMMSMRDVDERLQDANIYELIHACSRALPHITSTADLPDRIQGLPDDPRTFVIHELYTTEYTYVKRLEVLSEVFKGPLSAILGDETGSIFANVDDILEFNKGFLALLHSRITNWTPDQCIGDIFIGMFTQSHKSMYAIYCSNYDTAEMLVHQKIKKKKEFEQQLQLSLAHPSVMTGLTLQAYLINPVQRIPRYILLIKDIIKRTPPEHPDYRNLDLARQRMGELAHYIDAQVKESQTKRTFDSLKNKVHGLADLDSADRSLVKEGQVYFKNIRKLYQCILFNDMLVFAHGDSKLSVVEQQLPLEAVWIEDLEDLDPQTSHEDAIEVYTPERPYTIYTRSSNEKRLWVAKLRETIYHHLYKENKCHRSDTCDTLSRYATFVYSDGRVYSGNYIDSRRHGKGTMTWPNKTFYVGDWVDDERSGEGEFTYNTGDVYRGRWTEDRQNGMGELQYASNDIYRGHWKDGFRHGKGKILYANGDVFEGQFVMGQIEGRGKLKCQNGVEYEGEWKHSQRHGNGTLKTLLGKVYKGDFRFNHIHGQGAMEYKDGDKYEGSWKYGMRQGVGKLSSSTLGVYEGTWEKDMRHGRGKLTYPNGDVYEGDWELNKRHGSGKLVFSTKEVYDGEFSEDVIHGEGEMKYNGVSKFHGAWINGLRSGQGTMVYKDSSSYNGDWLQGLRHGHGEFVNIDGSVYRGQWVQDKPHGKGTFQISTANYTYNGDFVCGVREGRGEEHSQYGTYKGCWKTDMKHGHGEERTLVGTIFVGSWERNRKHGRGVKRMVFGTVEDEEWRNGQLISDPARMTAVELPYISRNDY